MKYVVIVTAKNFPPFREVTGLTDQSFDTFEDARKAILSRFRGLRKVAFRGTQALIADATGQVATWRDRTGTVAIHEDYSE